MISAVKEALISVGGIKKDVTEDGTDEVDLEGWVACQWKKGENILVKGNGIMVLAKLLVCKSTRKSDQPIFLKCGVEVEEKWFKIRKVGYSEEDFKWQNEGVV